MGVIKESMSFVAGIPLNLKLIIDKTPIQGKKSVEAPAPVVSPSPDGKAERPPSFTLP